MKLKIDKRHILFSLAYCFTLLTLLLNQIDSLPMAMTLRKTKYAYVLFVLILFFMGKRVKRRSGIAITVWSLFFVHTILFGFVFNNSEGARIAANNISTNVTQMIWYLLMVGVTYLYVSQNGIFKQFISLSFYTCGFQLIVAALKHRHDFVNPVWGLIQSFASGVRYKTQFGFVHPGYLSNACFLVIVVSLFFFELNRRDKDLNKRMIMWGSLIVIDGLAAEMLLCAAERSGIISTAIAVLIYFVFVFLRVKFEFKTKAVFMLIVGVTIAVLAAAGVFAYVWEHSNRDLNIRINYPIFQRLGHLWTGMGYVDNSGFNEKVLAFVERTSSLDLYYVYIFFTTGILGCILIGLALVIMLVRLIAMKKTPLNITVIATYCSMLFFAFWQCNMVTYRYVSPTILFSILLFGMSDDCCMEDESDDEGNDDVPTRLSEKKRRINNKTEEKQFAVKAAD